MYAKEYKSDLTPRQAFPLQIAASSAHPPEPVSTTIDAEYRLSQRAGALMRLANAMWMKQAIARRPGDHIDYRDEIPLAGGAKLGMVVERGVVRLALTYTPGQSPYPFRQLRPRSDIRRIVRAHSAAPEQKFRLRGDDFNGGLIAVLARHVEVRDGVLRVDFTEGRYRAALWLTAAEAHLCIAPCPLLDRPDTGPLFGGDAA